VIFPAEKRRLLYLGGTAGPYVLCKAMSDPEIDGSWENIVKYQDGQFTTRAAPGEWGIFKKLPLS